jgi:hypothetical protein
MHICPGAYSCCLCVTLISPLHPSFSLPPRIDIALIPQCLLLIYDILVQCISVDEVTFVGISASARRLRLGRAVRTKGVVWRVEPDAAWRRM